ncbi:TIGR01459 family HAD-type hydrolase [uncultured Cohaesibacter sp.]|uniref:TIGR01459 family HAD-type hydrolase n=1 Tax=uncultured Cohaesibacter sp. TaxID=1002546 RepID=UPI0029300EEB|nr:TIGR01459 family HAD-type hydrolase [uncultured Cohaesibacter sp.]
MTSRLAGLSAIAPNYKGILSDIWGVLHNGVAFDICAVDSLTRFRKDYGPVILLTNAPRPSGSICEQLDRLKVPRDCYDAVVTSGDVSRKALLDTGKTKVLHIGPERDFPLYEGLDLHLVGEDEAEMVSCTGLLDDTIQTPDDYDELLKRLAQRDLPFVCANPDRIVDRGGKLVYCAGSLADRFEAYGGEPTFVGKPEAPIYKAAIAELNKANGAPVDKSDMLIVGDSLPTDMRGAHYQKIDALFITSGIHAEDFGPTHDPDDERVTLRLTHEDVESIGFMTRLAW